MPGADAGAEFLFQVIAERPEKMAVIVTTNLPFSEWTQVVPNPRLCEALLDRVTDPAGIIETGRVVPVPPRCVGSQAEISLLDSDHQTRTNPRNTETFAGKLTPAGLTREGKHRKLRTKWAIPDDQSRPA